MVLYKNNILILLIIVILGLNYVKCSNYVPAYIWGTIKVSDHVPALHKTSQNSFTNGISEYLKENPFVVIFAEYTLSPEDFAQRNSLGEIAFTHLSEFKKTSNVDYRPVVGDPIPAIKKLNKPITELSITSFLNNQDVPRDNILIIHLNDAKDDEDRFKMLQRHDSQIAATYNSLVNKYSNVLAVYTALHTSRVAPDELLYKQPRRLLEEEEGDVNTGIVFRGNELVLMFISSVGYFRENGKNYTINGDYLPTATMDRDLIIFTLALSPVEIKFNFTLGADSYWTLSEVVAASSGSTTTFSTKDVFAPISFSYHCSDLVLESKEASLNLPGFQIQPFNNRTSSNSSVFGDAYDCVGFTSVPIWSGLFVTLILLLIMTFGLTMMMDIKTMDRFDDAKGKTITINASE